MATRFVEVPAPAIRDRLAGAGFRITQAPGAEEVYARHHDKDRRYVVKVYSSIRSGKIRGRGADAIRVVALLVTDQKTYPIFQGEAGASYRLSGSDSRSHDRASAIGVCRLQ